MSLRGSTPTPNVSSLNPASPPSSKSAPMTSRAISLTQFLHDQSAKLTTDLSTITIKYTCPHCSAEHSLDFPWSSLMNTKTYHQLTMPCSNGLLNIDLLESVIHIRTYMDFEEPRLEGLVRPPRPIL